MKRAGLLKTGLFAKQIFRVVNPPGFQETTMKEIQSVIANPWFSRNKDDDINITIDNTSSVNVENCDYRTGLELVSRLKTAEEIEMQILKFNFKKHNFPIQVTPDLMWKFKGNIKDHIEEIKKFFTLFYDSDSINPLDESEDSLLSIFTKSKRKDLSSRTLKNMFIESLSKRMKIIDGPTRASIPLLTNQNRIYSSIGSELITYINLNGRKLSERGYKKDMVGIAPLTENLAAACIQTLLSDLSFMNNKINTNNNDTNTDNKDITIVDMMSGSGTIGLESIIELFNISNIVWPRVFAFERIKNADYISKSKSIQPTIKFLKNKSQKDILESDSQVRVILNDYNDTAHKISKMNSEHFLSHIISDDDASIESKLTIENTQYDILKGRDLTALTASAATTAKDSTLLLCLNPPQQLRLGEKIQNLNLFFEKIGKSCALLIEKVEPKHFAGFVIVPVSSSTDEDTESESFIQSMRKHSSHKVYQYTKHFSQGGHHKLLVCFSNEIIKRKKEKE